MKKGTIRSAFGGRSMDEAAGHPGQKQLPAAAGSTARKPRRRDRSRRAGRSPTAPRTWRAPTAPSDCGARPCGSRRSSRWPPKPSVTSSTTQTKRLRRSAQSSVVIAIETRISAPPMVGVPLLDAGAFAARPSRTDWPILFSVSLRIIARTDDEGDDQRGHRRQHRAQRHVAEDVEGAHIACDASWPARAASVTPPRQRRSARRRRAPCA